jgi:putative ATP-dependent endonuclease of OLD family
MRGGGHAYGHNIDFNISAKWTITIAGFRSFGPAPHRIDLAGDLTAVVGPNASGKSALLQALTKLFGVTRARRTIHRSDFHLPVGTPPAAHVANDFF